MGELLYHYGLHVVFILAGFAAFWLHRRRRRYEHSRLRALHTELVEEAKHHIEVYEQTPEHLKSARSAAIGRREAFYTAADRLGRTLGEIGVSPDDT